MRGIVILCFLRCGSGIDLLMRISEKEGIITKEARLP